MARRGRRKKRGGSRAGRIVAWVAGVLLVLVIVGYFGVTAWVRSYLHGEGFRMMASEKAAELMRAEGEFGAFHWAETTARVDGFSAKGYEDAAFSRLDLEGLLVEVNAEAAKDGVWELRKVEANRLEVEVSKERLGGDAPVAPTGADGSGEGWLARFLPTRFEVRGILVKEANVRVSMGADQVVAQGMRVEVVPEAEGRAALSIEGGKVLMDGMPEVELVGGSGRVTPETIFVTEVRGRFMDGAALRAEGTVERTTPPEVQLGVEFDGLAAEKVLPEDWQKRLTGTLNGKLTVSGRGGEGGYAERGRIDLEKGVIEALPILDEIAKYTRTDNFRRLPLSEAWMRFERAGGRIDAPEVVLESAGLLRVEGHLTIDQGVAEGLFQVGVTPGTLRWLPSAEAKVFTREERGFRWAAVRVWGDTGDLQQDLSRRLVAAAVEGTAEAVIDGATSLLPAPVKEGGKEAVDSVIDQGGELIKQGSELLRGLLPFGE